MDIVKCSRCGQSSDAEEKAGAWALKIHRGEIVKKAVYDAIVSDRDEWKQQHENLLSVRQSDLAVIESLRQQLAKPAPEAQILIDALRKIVDGRYKQRNAMNDTEMADLAREALAIYDTKATPDNGVEK